MASTGVLWIFCILISVLAVVLTVQAKTEAWHAFASLVCFLAIIFWAILSAHGFHILVAIAISIFIGFALFNFFVSVNE